MNTGYPTMAKVIIYDFAKLQATTYWHDTYRQALKAIEPMRTDKKIIIGTIEIVEVIK